jgi:hypothetical protein
MLVLLQRFKEVTAGREADAFSVGRPIRHEDYS